MRENAPFFLLIRGQLVREQPFYRADFTRGPPSSSGTRPRRSPKLERAFLHDDFVIQKSVYRRDRTCYYQDDAKKTEGIRSKVGRGEPAACRPRKVNYGNDPVTKTNTQRSHTPRGKTAEESRPYGNIPPRPPCRRECEQQDLRRAHCRTRAVEAGSGCVSMSTRVIRHRKR